MVAKAKRRRILENDVEEEYGRGKAWKKRGRESDDDDEEEDDEGDMYEEHGGKHQKRRARASQFIDDMAFVASDDESEESEAPEDGFLVDPETDLPDENDGRQIHSPLPYNLLDDQEEEDDEYLESMIRQRYMQRNDEYGDEEEATEVVQQTLLPSVRDPKLWMVKCAIGREREVAVCLMQKCIERGEEIQIKSAIALDNLKNYIYIEAEKEAYVREACKGMRNIYASKILLVPIKEMTDVLSVKSEAVEVCRDTWVRLKRGTYKGDLAKVVDLDNLLQKVTLKLIPRINLISLAAKLEGEEVKKNGFTPPPRLMNSDEARGMHIPVHRRYDPNTRCYFEIIGGLMFKDGFLYKKVSMKSITTHNIHPTFDEVEQFRHGNGGDLTSLSSLCKHRKKGHFMKGDRVIAVKGDLKNLKGSVEKVEKDTVYIKLNEHGILDTVAVRENELCKYFEPGNHVKVISGVSKGVTGMVVSVEGHMVNIVSDATKELLRVFADCIVGTSEVTAGISCIGYYALHDLVLLHGTSFGVIVKIEPEVCHVLIGVPEKPEIALVRLRDIKSRLEKKHTSKDRYGNKLSANDMVKVLEGPSRGRQGRIAHIFRDILFIHDVHHIEHAGFMCVKCQSCVLIGGSQANTDRKSGSFQSRRDNLRRHVLATPSPMGAHTKIKICKGNYKGCRGVVKEVRGNCFRVELEAQMKIVTVTRDEITDDLRDSSSFRGPSRFARGSETPIHPSQTPLRPLLTPMREYPATPLHYGMSTPLHHGTRTPTHERTHSPTSSLSSCLSRGMLLDTVR